MNLPSLRLGQFLFRRERQPNHSNPFDELQQNRGQNQLHEKQHKKAVILLRKHWIYAAVIMTVLLYPTYSAHAMDALHASFSLNHTPTIRPTLRISAPMSVFAELRLTWRLVYAGILGAILGNERRSRSSHQSAGVRTMALVSLGAAMFTLSSMYGFHGITGGRYDPSRMASNVASGVGFIGAGVITTSNGGENQPRSVVHGLTTAAAIWLSAAVGVAVGVGLPFLSTAACLLTIFVLRIGRRDMQQFASVEERYNKTLQYVDADPSARNVREQPLARHHKQQRLQENYNMNHTSDNSRLSRDYPPMVSDEHLLLQTQSSDKTNLTFESMQD
jgi:putative Mg2+ transporter-C (MgtC) family protein